MEQQAGKNYEALTLGQRAGQLGLPASLNPYDPDSPEHAEWLRAWRAALASALRRAA